MNELNSKLKNRAVSLGLCKPWTKEWCSDCSQQELIVKYKKGLDFCIMHNYPNNEFIKANFDRKLLNENLVFVDEVVSIDGGSGIYVLNGKCTGIICFGNFSVGTLHVRHDCDLSIEVSGMAKIFVSVYDNATVSVRQEDAAKVYVYKKSSDCTVNTTGDIMMREKG